MNRQICAKYEGGNMRFGANQCPGLITTLLVQVILTQPTVGRSET